MIINFIRHGMTENNENGVISGALIDAPLSKRGEKLIKELKSSNIYPDDLGVCYVSELMRTMDTLMLISPGKTNVFKTSLLNERSFGVFEFMSAKEVDEYLKGKNISNFGMQMKLENGESGDEFYKRVKRDFKKLLDIFYDNKYETVTIVGHGAYLRAVAFNFCFDERLGSFDYIVDNGKGVIFETVSRSMGEIKLNIKGYIGGDSLDEIRGVRIEPKRK